MTDKLPFPFYQQGDDLPMPDGSVAHIVQPSTGESSSTEEAVIHARVLYEPGKLDEFLEKWYRNNP